LDFQQQFPHRLHNCFDALLLVCPVVIVAVLLRTAAEQHKPEAPLSPYESNTAAHVAPR
jgi:hypothetical protein